MYILVKWIYLTAMYRCDQDTTATPNIIDAVLERNKKDKSSVSVLAVFMGI